MNINLAKISTLLLATLLAACAHAPSQNTSTTILEDTSEFQQLLLPQITPTTKPDELFLLETAYPGGGDGGCIEITRTANTAQLRYIEESNHHPRTDRYFSRPLSPKELSALLTLAQSQNLDHLVPIPFSAFDGVEYRYTHATPASTFQVVLNNPCLKDSTAAALIAHTQNLLDAQPLACTYTIPLPAGTKVLYANTANSVRRVWANGDDIRALIGPSELITEEWQSYTHGRWRPCTPPPDPLFNDSPNIDPHQFGMDWIHFQAPWNHRIIACGMDFHTFKRGTFLIDAESKPTPAPVKILPSMLEFPLLIPDTSLLIGSQENHLVCYDVSTNTFLPLADYLLPFQVLAYIPEKKAVLLVHRAMTPQGEDKSRCEWRLVSVIDHQAGKIQLDTWAEAALASNSTLQPSSVPGIFWATHPFPKDKQTNIYRFNRNLLKPIGEQEFILHGLLISSHHMWIDEKSRLAYIVYDGQLLQIPIPPSALEPSHP